MDMVHVALAHADDGHAGGDDRYMVHVITGLDGTGLADGTPLDPVTASVVACDASVVAHLLAGAGEPLALGRKTCTWSTAQRRAALATTPSSTGVTTPPAIPTSGSPSTAPTTASSAPPHRCPADHPDGRQLHSEDLSRSTWTARPERAGPHTDLAALFEAGSAEEL